MTKQVLLPELRHEKTRFLGENKGADQLHSNCEADQRLCFRYSDSTIPLFISIYSQSFKPLGCFCTGRFVTNLVGNPEDCFSRIAAHLICGYNDRQQGYLRAVHSTTISAKHGKDILFQSFDDKRACA